MRDSEAVVGVPRGWVRLRGIAEAGIEENTISSTVADTQASLARLRAQGLKSCVLLRWEPKSWGNAQGLEHDATRPRGHLPSDLRLAYERCRRLEATYGGLVDAWEIDNEPDLRFVPENAEHYTAFLKAAYLGFKAGAARSEQSPASRPPQRCATLVVMAPMGLPPGPWFERFVANDGLAYTDRFNFHFYGYAEDFTGVFRTFQEAVLVASNQHLAPSDQKLASSNQPLATRLPVFATEIGYGMLGMRERDSKAARLRQWRWFKSVGEQAAKLGIDAPMAFYLQRYHEDTGLEFGLTVPHTSPKRYDLYARGGWYASDNYFTLSDFGAAKTEDWMRGIGKRVAGGDATPALAWWLAQTSAGVSKRAWHVETVHPSPVVIDLIAHENVYGEHRYNGYFVRGTGTEVTGRVDLVLYNFSDRPVEGSLRLPSCLQINQPDAIKLAPMERRVIPATVTVRPRIFSAQSAAVTFVSAEVPAARFATQFYPQFDGRHVANERPLTEDRVAQSPFSLFEQDRWRAIEEAPKHRDHACWVQEGASVKWTADGFAVTITGRTPHKERRVEVEIPWPRDFVFAPDRFLRLEYRATKLAPRGTEWPDHDEFLAMVRTANGNLYAGAPMRNIREHWSVFWEPPGNFTLWFYGRAHLPWEFRKNRPVSLVLVFYPVALPVTYEFRRPALVSLAPLE